MFKRKSFERYKCLNCATFYERPTEEWVKFNKDLAEAKDPNLVINPIECPKCKGKKFQHIPKIVKDYKKEFFKIVDSITTFLGKICGSITSLLIAEYNANAPMAIEYVVGFLFLVFGIKFAHEYLSLDLVWSSTLVMLFFIIKKIRK